LRGHASKKATTTTTTTTTIILLFVVVVFVLLNNIIFALSNSRPVYKKTLRKLNNQLTATYELDTESELCIFEQEPMHMSDDDLFKFLGDYRAKEKYFPKLVQIGGKIKLFMNDFSSNVFEQNGILNKSSNESKGEGRRKNFHFILIKFHLTHRLSFSLTINK
jgi:hypothetical protein